MHMWGDGFEYFEDVGRAAYEIGKFCRKYGRIHVTQTKEKYGSARVYCSFGYYSLHGILFPGWHFKHKSFPQWLWALDIHYIPYLFKPFAKLLTSYQIYIYKTAYKRAIIKYPHIKKEILCGADYSEFLKGL